MIFFAIYQHESATGIHVCPPSWTPLPTLSLWASRSSSFGSLLHNKQVFNMNLPLKTNKRLIHHFALEIIQCQNWKLPSNPTTHLLLESSLISFLGHLYYANHIQGQGIHYLQLRLRTSSFQELCDLFFTCRGFQPLV